MIKKIVLHIGLHKTGTTSFQKFVLENENVFFKKGIHPYKPIYRNHSYTANEIGLSVLRPGVIDDLVKGPWNVDIEFFDKSQWRDRISARIEEICKTSDCKVLLISGEWMSFIRTQGEIDALKKLFPSFIETHIVMVRRKKSDWWRSYCSEVAKWKDRIPGPVNASRNSHAHLDPSGWLMDFEIVEYLFRKNFNSISTLEYNHKGMVGPLLYEMGITDEVIDEPRHNSRGASPGPSVSVIRRIYRQYLSQTSIGHAFRRVRAMRREP